jgi:hypothetical protein
VQFLTAAKSMKRKFIGFFARLMDSSKLHDYNVRCAANIPQFQSLELLTTPEPALATSGFLKTILA